MKPNRGSSTTVVVAVAATAAAVTIAAVYVISRKRFGKKKGWGFESIVIIYVF